MASFRDDPSVWQQLDFLLLRDSPVTMYFRAEVLRQDTEWLAAHSYRIDTFDCSEWRTEEAAHTSLASTLEFPSYYGRNLDALNDCMSDVAVPDEAGRVLVFTRFDVPARAMHEFACAVLDIIAARSRHNLLFGRRLLALVQSDDARLELPPIAACGVGWNRREWSNSARGVT